MAEPTEPSGDGLAFLQRRVGWFGLVSGGLTLAFLLFRLLTDRSPNALDGSMLSHAGAGLCLVGMWAALRGKLLPARWVRIIELAGLVAASTLFVLMGTYIPLVSDPARIVVMALAVVHLSRAIYVPSSAGRTALLASLTGLVIVASVFEESRHADLRVFAAFAPEIMALTRVEFAAHLAVDALAWWTVFAALAAAASRVIYGLRKQVGTIRELGQYHIEAEIGAGAMGVVYRARHALLRRETAVKLLPPEKAGEATIQRFEREVKLTARLKHPNTVTVYDYGRTPEGVFYYAMELLDGATLEQVVNGRGPLPIGRVLHVLEQAAGALAEAHELGLIHRDIKPANIMLCNQGGQVNVVKVLDFGLVKDTVGESPQVTQANTITGTPLYMSPEAITNPESIDARSDLYALGAVAYFVLVGDHVFLGQSLVEICSKHLCEAPEPPSTRSGRSLPETLERLVLDCLEKSPERRPQSARDLLARLARIDRQGWDRHAAESWWREHGSSVRAASIAPTDTGRTIQVNLARGRSR